jgi:hypothetical protein
LKVVQLASGFHPVMLALRGRMPQAVSATPQQARTRATTPGAVAEAGLDRFLELAAQLPDWKRYS